MLAFFLAVASETRIGRLDRKWPFISVRALSRSASRLKWCRVIAGSALFSCKSVPMQAMPGVRDPVATAQAGA